MSIWRPLVRLSSRQPCAQIVHFKFPRNFMSAPVTTSRCEVDMIKNDKAASTSTSSDAAIPNHHEGNNDNDSNKRKKKNSYERFKKKNKNESIDGVLGNVRKEFCSEKNTIPHEGSYACPAMQGQFNISLPEEPPSDGKVSKKRVAILMSYVGSKFAGFQINKEQRTIQAELELALYKAGLLQKSNFGFPHKYGWSVSGRTDKGVHACAQVCSAKLEVGELLEDEVRERINEHLHPDVLVLDVKRTLRSFCAKTQRSRVRYQYMIPSYLFHADAKKLFNESGIGERLPGADPLTPEEIQSVRAKIKDYRVTPHQLETLKSALARYVGTHAYHNFTRSMNLGDSSSKRYILEFKANDPVIHEDGTEWISTEVVGQSFLLNQIRKMIALACDVVCERATLETMEKALDYNTRMILPIAPAQGLFLDMSVYDFYNDRKDKRSNDVDVLDWINNPESPAMVRWKKFKDERVLKTIFDEEMDDGSFVTYSFMQTNLFEWEVNYRLDKTSE